MAKWYPGRKLSLARLSIVLVVLAGLVGGGVYTWSRVQDVQVATERTPWFDSYVDVTATPSFPFESPGENGQKNVVLSFIVAAPDDVCSPSWGGYYDMDQAENSLDLDRKLQRLRNLGGSAMVSFGGQANHDIAYECDDQGKLVDGYTSVVERYDLASIDMDIEGAFLSDEDGIARQAEAIGTVQDGREKGLDVWLTLPVAPDGLTFEGLQAIRTYLKAGVDLAGVNVMTMNYNSETEKEFYPAVESSLEATQSQLRSLYQEIDAPIGEATAWSRVAATPMIGQNDTRKDIFTIADAEKLSAFADDRGMARLSMWSLNRDQQCSANWPDPKQVSDSCSGVVQEKGDFSKILREHRTGAISQVAEEVENDGPVELVEDDPETSPYPIWSETTSYPAETKVVWHRNVYEAKWWTEGDQPDLAAENGSQPWTLLGPVLPGEKPIERPKLPADAYPDWDSAKEYRRGERVIFDGDGFEAKWYSLGDSPDAALVQPQESPWRVLTDAEIAEVTGSSNEASTGANGSGAAVQADASSDATADAAGDDGP
ncbi:glycosyl hydrolase family 18 [Leucobacter sp. NPDC077196]|uniref:chitinase n=1 Tax=Leucobacter sp. NPDC077196 TaxID=3154959 RepID=UPI00343118D9